MELAPTLDELLCAELLHPEAHQRYGPVATGFEPLDACLDGGFRAGELVVVAGRPGVGKTVTLLQWARTAAMVGVPTTIASYEHDELTTLTSLWTQEVAELADEEDVLSDARACSLLSDVAARRISAAAALRDDLVSRAHQAMNAWAPSLSVVARTGLRRGIEAFDELARGPLSAGGMLVVDYVQKVPQNRHDREEDNVREVLDALKLIAVERELVVVTAAAVADHALLGRRLRLGDLRQASMVAHDADIVVALSDKVAAVSRRHTAFDTTKLDAFRNQTIFSVEKNRRGRADVHLEFRQDFAHLRFHRRGRFVSEQLVDDVVTS